VRNRLISRLAVGVPTLAKADPVPVLLFRSLFSTVWAGSFFTLVSFQNPTAKRIAKNNYEQYMFSHGNWSKNSGITSTIDISVVRVE